MIDLYTWTTPNGRKASIALASGAVSPFGTSEESCYSKCSSPMPKVTRREVGVWYEHFWTQCCPSVPCSSGGRVHAHFWPLRYQAPGPVASSGRALDGFEIVRQTGQAQRGRAPPQGLMLGNRRRGGTVKRHTLAHHRAKPVRPNAGSLANIDGVKRLQACDC